VTKKRAFLNKDRVYRKESIPELTGRRSGGRSQLDEHLRLMLYILYKALLSDLKKNKARELNSTRRAKLTYNLSYCHIRNSPEIV
jgi:hypothetical protein